MVPVYAVLLFGGGRAALRCAAWCYVALCCAVPWRVVPGGAPHAGWRLCCCPHGAARPARVALRARLPSHFYSSACLLSYTLAGSIEVQHEQGLLRVDGWARFKAPARIAGARRGGATGCCTCAWRLRQRWPPLHTCCCFCLHALLLLLPLATCQAAAHPCYPCRCRWPPAALRPPCHRNRSPGAGAAQRGVPPAGRQGGPGGSCPAFLLHSIRPACEGGHAALHGAARPSATCCTARRSVPLHGSTAAHAMQVADPALDLSRSRVVEAMHHLLATDGF